MHMTSLALDLVFIHYVYVFGCLDRPASSRMYMYRIPVALSYPNMPKMDWSTWSLIWIRSQEVRGKEGPVLSRGAHLERNQIRRPQPSGNHGIVPFPFQA